MFGRIQRYSRFSIISDMVWSGWDKQQSSKSSSDELNKSESAGCCLAGGTVRMPWSMLLGTRHDIKIQTPVNAAFLGRLVSLSPSPYPENPPQWSASTFRPPIIRLSSLHHNESQLLIRPRARSLIKMHLEGRLAPRRTLFMAPLEERSGRGLDLQSPKAAQWKVY